MGQATIQKQEELIVKHAAIRQFNVNSHTICENRECLETQILSRNLEIEGNYGTITVQVASGDNTNTGEDLHSLLARVLLKKQKRLAKQNG
ncbi:hypothetical protein [Ornithinibacillus sp. JPR2-1]|uniref:hypothetical protein n=1 Tax=Ornithinibacillus sp. JPR2-1 TaxID=2094019 RepID=UPI0031D37259